MKLTLQAKKKPRPGNLREKIADFIISILLAILAGASVLLFFLPARDFVQANDSANGIFIPRVLSAIVWFQNLPYIEIWVFVILCLAIICLLLAYSCKLHFIRSSAATQAEYTREKKINAVNRAVFESLNQVNNSKSRETLRYTYGCVPEWNPIDYRHNILLYDVHEQIRAILICLKQVVINLDPSRFNDQNVSVELVYCYPGDDPQKGSLPYQPKKYLLPQKNVEYDEDYEKRIWKLISSGDTSGNHSKVIQYLENPASFYTLLDYCGIIFANNKFENMLEANQVDSFRTHLLRSGFMNNYNVSTAFYAPDTKDMEHAPGSGLSGSAAGAIINIRNDDPEETFVKAILTINTYGETIHVPEQKGRLFKKTFSEDKFGMTVDDYSKLFCDTILSTYITLLASELSQMYIRHAIRNGKICRLTGRSRNSYHKKCTLKIEECLQCEEECKQKKTPCKVAPQKSEASISDIAKEEEQSGESE